MFFAHLLVFPYNPESNLGIKRIDNITIEFNENDYLYPKLVGEQKLLDVNLKEFICWKNGFKLNDNKEYVAEKTVKINYNNKLYEIKFFPSDLKLVNTQSDVNNINDKIIDLVYHIKNDRDFRNNLTDEKTGIDFKGRYDLKKLIVDLNDNDSKENKIMEALPAPLKSELSFNTEDLQSENINNMSFSFLWEKSRNAQNKNELTFTSEDLKSNLNTDNLSFSFLWQDSKKHSK